MASDTGRSNTPNGAVLPCFDVFSKVHQVEIDDVRFVKDWGAEQLGNISGDVVDRTLAHLPAILCDELITLTRFVIHEPQ